MKPFSEFRPDISKRLDSKGGGSLEKPTDARKRFDDDAAADILP